MPAAIAIPALISAGSSIAGGIMQHRAAGQAANAQVAATQGATDLVNQATGQVNPALAAGADAAGQAVLSAAGNAGAGVIDATGRAGAGVTAAAGTANQYLNPYIGAGQTAVTNLAQLASGPGFTFSQDDPSYQWRLQEGQKALERSAAAHGVTQSGGMLKALTRYAQGAASTEYGAAFDRYQREKQGNASIFANLAGMGLTAGGRAGDNTLTAARYAGDMDVLGQRYNGDTMTDATRFASGLNYDATRQQGANTLGAAQFGAQAMMGAGDSRAAEAIAKGNAWSGTLGGVGNAAQSYFTMRALQPPSTPAGPNATNYAGYFGSMGVKA